MNNKPNEISGTRMVVGMFLFAIAIIAALWTYTYFHAAPFRPLRLALAEHFEGSAPKVDGGQRKIHKQTPMMLRIVMKVTFDPSHEVDRAEQFSDEVIAIAGQHHDISQYETLEIHLYQLNPEKEIIEWKTERKIETTSDP